MGLILNTDYLGEDIDREIALMEPVARAAFNQVWDKSGAGGDFLGWTTRPVDYDKSEFAAIKAAAAEIRKTSKVLVVIGVGGSYLGSRAVIEALRTQFYNEFAREGEVKVYFAGTNISDEYLRQIINICENNDFSINMISKSGTTTEPALAFRFLSEILEKKYGRDAAIKRIFCTTDAKKGTLKALADTQGYKTFIVPDDIGGRYSVFSAVGLLPIAVAGIDIDSLIQGAASAYAELKNFSLKENSALRYAIIRNLLLQKGYTTEYITGYEPSLAMLNEWFKQLFGESEGKDNKGIMPNSAIFSTDLHSVGQYIQEGRRNLFETVIHFAPDKNSLIINKSKDDFDGLNFLAGKTVAEVNDSAFSGTVIAHTDGGVPNIIIELKEKKEHDLGYLLYFFMLSCTISGYILGVNPFDQPGVEAYKKNMFTLLKKPGYEEGYEELAKRIN